jgi:hypothetical protein
MQCIEHESYNIPSERYNELGIFNKNESVCLLPPRETKENEEKLQSMPYC